MNRSKVSVGFRIVSPELARTLLDGTDDGGGISESSGVSEETADPKLLVSQAARHEPPSTLKELRSNSPAARNEQPSTSRRGCSRLRTKNNGRPHYRR
jgi:hypothetical protein